MGSYILTQDSTVEIGLLDDYRDNGWTVANNIGTHSSCNAGKMLLKGFNYVVGVPNTFRYVVRDYSSGIVRLSVGAQNGANISSNGDHYETFTPNANDEVAFYSDGNLSVELLEIYTNTIDETATTLAFDEKSNRWVGYYSFTPEMMGKFKSKFFMFSNGQLWESHTNTLRNTFFGVAYPSKIVFYVNLNPTQVKQFYSIREKSNEVWSVTEAYIPPRVGKSKGQRSRLKKGRFKRLQGDWFASFMRDMEDPRFFNELDALVNGAELQGNIMRIELENTDTTEVRLLSVDILTSKKDYTY